MPGYGYALLAAALVGVFAAVLLASTGAWAWGLLALGTFLLAGAAILFVHNPTLARGLLLPGVLFAAAWAVRSLLG